MDWKSCCKQRIVKPVHADEALCSSLFSSSKDKMVSQEQLVLTEVTASSKISLAYDALRELLEMLALQQGYKIYNHECYTAFLKEILQKSPWGDEFDELRRIRNAINYYGKAVLPEEAREVILRMKRLRQSLFLLVKK